jgi:hypothetical protein
MTLADQLGIDGGAKVSGARSLELTRRYVRNRTCSTLPGRTG